jgi:DNA-binding FrmR family transcriptional regulator
MFSFTQRVPNHTQLTPEEQKKMSQSLSRIIGQIQNIKSEIDANDACNETFVQLLAARGGLNKLATELVSLGILDCIQHKSKKELQHLIQNIFKVS